MAKQIVSTNSAPAAIGPYSQAVRIGNLIFVSGQIALDPATGQLVVGDIQVQTRQVLKNLSAILMAEGCELAEDVHIMQSVLWPRVRVGRGVTIERSIVMNDVTIPDGAHLVGKVVSTEEIIDL